TRCSCKDDIAFGSKYLLRVFATVHHNTIGAVHLTQEVDLLGIEALTFACERNVARHVLSGVAFRGCKIHAGADSRIEPASSQEKPVGKPGLRKEWAGAKEGGRSHFVLFPRLFWGLSQCGRRAAGHLVTPGRR